MINNKSTIRIIYSYSILVSSQILVISVRASKRGRAAEVAKFQSGSTRTLWSADTALGKYIYSEEHFSLLDPVKRRGPETFMVTSDAEITIERIRTVSPEKF